MNITTIAGGVDNDVVQVAVILNGEVVVHETEIVVPDRDSMGQLPGTWQLIVGAQAFAEWIQLGGVAAAAKPAPEPKPEPAPEPEPDPDSEPADEEPQPAKKKAAAKKPAKKKAAGKAKTDDDPPAADLLD